MEEHKQYHLSSHLGAESNLTDAGVSNVSPDFTSAPNVAATNKSIIVGNGATQTIIDPNKGITGSPNVTIVAAKNGQVNITSGDRFESLAASSLLTVTGGAGQTPSISGGSVSISGGVGGTPSGVGGVATLEGGDSQGAATGGYARVEGGVGGTTGSGGAVTVTGGQGGTTSGTGGQLLLEGGDAAAGNSNGGDISILPGVASGAGTNGLLYLFASTFSTYAVTLDPSLITATRALKFPDASGTVALTNGVPLALFDHYTNVGNVNTAETDLYSDTTVASQLATNGDKLESEYGGTFVSSGTATRQIKIYFGGTSIFDTGALSVSLSAAWTAYVSIIRVSATVIRYMISLTTEGAALAAYTAVGEVTGLTLSNTNILKITGTAAGVGAASNDILAKMGSVSYVPHA